MKADTTLVAPTTGGDTRLGAPMVVVPLDKEGPWPVHHDEIEAGLEELEAAVKAVNDANAALLELMRRLLKKADQATPKDADALASVLRH
ncbi:MAG TPA: hypothetical protein VJ787_05720 [Thermoleophilia bacterium]|nr:hypothetical protein [Thermoleophilia bacterium]